MNLPIFLQIVGFGDATALFAVAFIKAMKGHALADFILIGIIFLTIGALGAAINK